MQPIVSSYTSWQPLEEVIVGRVFTPEHFDYIEDSGVQAQLGQLLSEAAEDLDNLQRVIEQYGATVRRPSLPGVHEFQTQQIKNGGVPMPP